MWRKLSLHPACWSWHNGPKNGRLSQKDDAPHSGPCIGRKDVSELPPCLSAHWLLWSRLPSGRYACHDIFPIRAIAVFAIITSRLADGRACNVNLEADVLWKFSFASLTSEVCFPYMDGLIALRGKKPGQGLVAFLQSFPVPIVRSIAVPIIALRINPVGRMMACRVLSGHNGGARRRTYAIGIKRRKANSLAGQPLHVGSTIPFIQRLFLRISRRICQERARRVHHSHVIHQENNDIRLLLC